MSNKLTEEQRREALHQIQECMIESWKYPQRMITRRQGNLVTIDRVLNLDRIADRLGAERCGKLKVRGGYFGALQTAVDVKEK